MVGKIKEEATQKGRKSVNGRDAYTCIFSEEGQGKSQCLASIEILCVLCSM